MRAPIRTLANARALAERLGAAGAQSHSELADVLAMPRASVYRLVDAMAAVDLVEVGADSLVSLTPRWLHLADAARGSLSEWAGAHDVLVKIAETTGLTVFLCVPRDHKAFCIDWVPGSGLELLILRPGRSLAPNAGAAGRLTLAYDPHAEAVLAQGAFDPLTPMTLVTADELRADMALSRAEHRTISLEDATIGIGAIAVPVMRGQGEFAATLSAAGVAADIQSRKEELTDELRTGASRLSTPPA